MKNEKKLSYSSLPRLFKKSYSEAKFKKKILKKLYIESDKKKVQSLFSQKIKSGKTEKVCVPKESEFTKKEIKELKVLAKSIKKNNGIIRSKAFIATASVFVSLFVIVITFKNPLLKMGIRSAMQLIYGSKCDIGSVKLEILDAKLTINKLAQANPNHPMKNFYEFEKLTLDFNLTQLLRSRFNVQNVEITGIAINTKRDVSGELPVKTALFRAKVKNDVTGFYQSLEKKSVDSLSSAKKSLESMFAQFDPAALYENVQSKMKTPTLCKEIESEVNESISTWKSKPGEIKANIEDFRTRSEKLASLNVKNLKTQQEIQSAIDDVAQALKSGQTVKNTLDSTVKSLSSEQKKITDLQKKLEESIKSDTRLVSSLAGSLSLSGAESFVSDSLDAFAYSVLGKYYPYLKMGISYLSGMKSSSKSDEDADAAKELKKQKENAKKEHKRYAGRYVYWRADTVPRVLIENIHGSGFGFDIKITDISSDMDKVGRPVVGKLTYTDKKRTHKGSVTLDARSKSRDALITASYSGNDFPLDMKLSKIGSVNGIPDINGNASLSGTLFADTDFSFGGKCSIGMNRVKLSSDAISPDYADKIYQVALSSVNAMNASFDFAFSEANGISLNVINDLDKQIVNGVKKSAGSYLSEVQKQASELVQKNLGENSRQVFEKFSDFSDIAKNIHDQQAFVDSINAKLREKQVELTKMLAKKAASTVSEKAGQALSNNAAAEKAVDAAANLLKGFKK